MIIENVIQNTEQWHMARLGVATASEFSSVCTNTGKASSSAATYRKTLFNEWLSQNYKRGFYGRAMEHGHVSEGQARLEYAMLYCPPGVEVTQPGFCYMDETRMVGCSPDGLVGDEGGLELKCPDPYTHWEYLKAGKLPTIYNAQVQGSMLVTGRPWWDFVSYCENAKMFRLRVYRDEEYILTLHAMLNIFIQQVLADREAFIKSGFMI